MRNLNSFTMTGVNKFDDAPDSLAGLCDMIRRAAKKARIIDRPFQYLAVLPESLTQKAIRGTI